MNKEVPRYRIVYEQLRKHIENGVFKEGDILPSENDLCAMHNVTRPTVRKALDMLTNEGFIKKRQGLGSIVLNRPKGIGILSFSGITSAVGSENLVTKVLIKPTLISWPEEFPFELNETERESGCIYFERLREINGKPVFYDVSYLPNINLPRFTARNLNNDSLFNILRENYQLEIKGGEQYIKALQASSKIQEQLQVPPESPILHLQRKLETNRVYFNLYSFLYCLTENYSLYGRF